MTASGPQKRSAVCSRHGLRYDPSLTSACALCRREQQPPPPSTGLRPWAILAGVLLLGIGGAWAWYTVERPAPQPPAPPATQVAAAPPAPATATPPILRTQPAPLPSADVPTTTVPDVVAKMELPPLSACPLVTGNAALGPTRWPVSASWHEGAAGYADAQREQDRSKAPMVVYFRTDWCPYCRQLEEGLLNDATVERYFRNELVKVRINPEDGSEERAVADQYGISSYPSVFIVGSKRAKPRRLSVRRKDQDDESVLRTPRELIADVEEHAQRTVKGLVYAGYEKREARNVEESIAVLTDALGLDPENPEAHLQRGLSHLAAGAREPAYEDFRAALAQRSDYRDVFGAVGLDLWDSKLWDEGVACWTVYLGRSQAERAYGYLWRSKMQYQRGDHASAREDAQAACQHGESEACELVAKLGG